MGERNVEASSMFSSKIDFKLGTFNVASAHKLEDYYWAIQVGTNREIYNFVFIE